MNGADTEGWGPLRQAADVLRGQLKQPGGYHRARAAGIAERLMGVKLGAAQEEVLGVWGEVYGKALGTLHGGVADPARAVALCWQLLAAAPGNCWCRCPAAPRGFSSWPRSRSRARRRRGNWPTAPFLEHLAARRRPFWVL
ncbi:hypothetical protein ACFYZ8_06270 [Streptomyces sp. NPDC001668]|uniref:hypothetical protein n=1 Tax=unclassified Streptomyces TaxID=2593676 RepID=UPI003690A336